MGTDATVLICTYNRCRQLEATLDSLAAVDFSASRWDVLVVDNNSTDATGDVVRRMARRFPVDLRYVFEPEPGKSNALNAGLAALDATFVAFTDDDVRVSPDWLRRIAEGFTALRCDYLAGRVLPMWESPPPSWLSSAGGPMWAAIALLDYGPDPLPLATRVPLGVNMAVTRLALQKVGRFNPRLGRRAGTLLGQEQREWCLRARTHGLAGYYYPSMIVRHFVPSDRLTKNYFRRWFFWRGISRALLYAETRVDMEMPEQTLLNFAKVPHVLGVPRYLYGKAALRLRRWAGRRARRLEAFEDELWLCFFAGIVRQRLRDLTLAKWNACRPVESP